MPPARRDDCPWCGSKLLRARTGAVDECQDCAHVFRNPQRTAEDVLLDQLSGEHAKGCAPMRRHHRATARAMLRLRPEPESWLDVGTGEARFPETARDLFPYTSFDGLDPTSRVLRAHAAERIEEAYVGNLTDPVVRTLLRARYDVVSLLHHLQHAPEPREEIRAALMVLRRGGHLVIETSNPQSAYATLLGKHWLPQSHPTHAHLTPLANLRTELESQGCTIVSADRRPRLSPTDLSATYRVIACKT
ncbi:class I SAM-dependent methyltransferase [Streptomyces sp. DG2A-72]|uniref:class I SAM-dependent methyltransferase n=1 Tax=Streptomyces sp. DG2A-72 TaxID=3051386 RepID=UPI00265C05E0|nr:class I SAM-dependent methyltransferase [Streptomyces sp. DG2A-72]MDO0932535.1 class I SAM-dependent methyltransferase [Streptomyces sp. DG2A-72]